jgi:hypothetical protein
MWSTSDCKQHVGNVHISAKDVCVIQRHGLFLNQAHRVHPSESVEPVSAGLYSKKHVSSTSSMMHLNEKRSLGQLGVDGYFMAFF